MFNWWTSSQVWWFSYKISIQWVYNHSMVTISNILEISHGCFRKKAGQLRSYFFKKNLGFFHFFTLSLEIPEKKQNSTPANSARLCYIPWKFHGQKSSSPPPACKLQIPHNFFLFTPGNSACYLFNTPGDSIFSSPPYHWSPILTQNIVPSLASYDYNRYELKQRLWNIMYKGDCLLKLQPLYFFALIFHAKLNALLDEIWNSYIFTLTTEWMLK